MRNRTLVPALAVSVLLLTACASIPTAPVVTGPGLLAQLPKELRTAGVLRVGSNLNYAPVDFKDPGTNQPSGLDIDLIDALGNYLGLRIQLVDEPFAQLIPDVQSNRLDLAVSAVIDTPDRQLGTDDTGARSNPGVDFVDYFLTGTSILVKAGNPLGIVTLDNLCGRTIALQSGTIQAEIAARQVPACQKAGKSLKIDQFATDAQALAEVDSGVAAADLNDYPVAAYNTEPDHGGGRYQVVGAMMQTSLYGITVNKSDTALRDVLAKALDQLIRNGGYDQILTKWNARDGAVPSSTENGGF
ncbi:ABC transporter substrate-binding protein [Kitasatospora sp. GAS204B]|uniref:ABC transporter substrate-binding protein n=1 Tax=unclassified Kitasatospora TaxID=2633591 RepID=UPI002474C626|nr:ABC transporter substrate-binding protein [Kitasatospora sp. GAS204B]MDH6116387.1 polar amino acid transport system substrate-binding protein [Kitasatospora sp. GAS204B]